MDGNDIARLQAAGSGDRRAQEMASMHTITAALVHEIRNPLVAIKTFFQLLPTRYDDAEFRETFARTASRELRRIDALLARVGTLPGGPATAMEPVHLADPIRHTVDLLRPQLDERRVAVRHVAEGTAPAIHGNLALLEQLFLNLCLNALDAMDHGGELTVRVGHAADGDNVIVAVSDTGPGIADDVLARIFDPFVSTKTRGSGLGLAICRSIVDTHHARLTARNNAGGPGSTFTVEFPIPVTDP